MNGEVTGAHAELLALLRQLRDAAGTNHTRIGERTGYQRQQVSAAFTGREIPSSDLADALDEALGAGGKVRRLRDRADRERKARRMGATLRPAESTPPPAPELSQAASHGNTPQDPAQGSSLVVAAGEPVPSVSGSGDGSSPPDPREVSPTNRRDLFALIGAGTTLGAVPVLTPADRLVLLEKTSRADSVLPLVEAQIASCVNAYRTTSPASLIAQIDSVQRFIDGILAKLTLRPADSARLWNAAAITAGLRGWVHNNAGDTDSARISLAEAHKRADLLDDDHLIAWTRYMQAIVEDYAGNPVVAQQYADDGLRHARSGPQRALLLSDAIAGTRATLGDAKGVDSAVDEAMNIVHGLPLVDHGPANATIVDDISTYHPASAASAGAWSYALLGKPEKVQEMASAVRVIVESESTHHRPYMLFDEALAVSRSDKRDPERIKILVGQGLTLALPFQAGHIGNRVKAIRRAVEPVKSHPAIGELIDTTRAWQERQRTLPA